MNRTIQFYSANATPVSSPTSIAQEAELVGPSLVILLCVLLGAASALGTVGNSLVLLSVIKFENLRSIPDLFIFSLSLSDLLVTTIYQPMKAYRHAQNSHLSTDLSFKVVSRALGLVALTASITNMFAVTVERLLSIRKPLKYSLIVTQNRVLVAIFGIWVFSVVCGSVSSLNHSFLIYLTIYFMLILIAIISIYVYIFVVAKRIEDSIWPVQHMPNGRNVRHEKKAAKTILIIVGVTLISWLPFLIIPTLISDATTKAIVFDFLQVLSVCNSSINPYIYCARSERYRTKFIQLLGLHKILRP